MTDGQSREEPGRSREPERTCLRIVVAALAVTAIFVAALIRYANAAEVATAVSAVAVVIGTVVDAYFGQAGTQPKRVGTRQPLCGANPSPRFSEVEDERCV